MRLFLFVKGRACLLFVHEFLIVLVKIILMLLVLLAR